MARSRAGAAPAAGIPLDDVVRAVLASRRYGSVDETLVRRLAAIEIPKARSRADAEKRLKRRLHQVFGAYCATPGRPTDWPARFAGVSADLDDPGLRARCRELLGGHASSRERTDLLDGYYRPIFALTGPPAVLLDLACGLNPLALPWMGLPPDVTYLAYDVDRELIALVDAFLSHVGVRHVAAVQDVIASPPAVRADVALLLKSLPCLERQQAGASERLLHAVDARHVVVSYPTRSLGGHGKGQARTYRGQLQALVAGEPWTVQELELANELVFVIGKPKAPPPPGEPSPPAGEPSTKHGVPPLRGIPASTKHGAPRLRRIPTSPPVHQARGPSAAPPPRVPLSLARERGSRLGCPDLP